MLNVSKYVSIVIPVYNEAESLPGLHESLNRVLESQVFSYEVIYVDDGSTDGTFPGLQRLAQIDSRVCIVRLARNFGQTAALAAGVAHSSGAVLIFMDGDLQNDPLDIPRLVATLEQGYDVVSGWRRSRKDAHLSRKLPSWLANRLISQVTGLHLHDYGCTLKAYRRELFQHIRLYGEMHRFIPAYAALAGATVAEIEVAHHARRFGASKYGLSRTVRVLLDLLTLKFLGSFGTKPSYAFGLPGLLSLAASALSGVTLLGARALPPHVRIRRNALLPLSVHLAAFGLHCLMLGLLAELLMRTYHESQSKPIYVVRTIVPIPPIADPEEETTGSLIAVS
ncbi:MAG: glycosyltransferase family 2 protein [Ktedonobacteraceae bacterium]|nr:glycosyltransferase family 2 protein [Ktedonobacteraceae bacterium]